MKQKPYQLTPSVIALQRGMFYLDDYRPSLAATQGIPMAYSMQAELMQLGYMLNNEALENLKGVYSEDVIRYHNEVIPYLIYIKGDGDYRPLYDGFPQQVMEISDMELFANAIRHYASHGQWVPNSYTRAKPTAFEHPNYKMLRPCSEGEFNRIFTDILSVNQSITPMDKEVIHWFLNRFSRERLKDLCPKEIPFKENLCFLLSTDAVLFLDFTYTDILRTATYMSGGDVSLAENTRFHLSNKQRKWIMKMLEVKTRENGKVGQAFLDSLEDLKKHRNKWLVLFNHIHADSKRFRTPMYENAQRVVEILRFHEKKIQTWNSKVENLNFCTKLYELSKRPGELARRLNSLLLQSQGKRIFANTETVPAEDVVVSWFRSVAHKISNKVLFELYTYFEGRREDQKQRTVFIKGARKPVKLEPLEKLPKKIVDRVQEVILNAVKSKFAAWPQMGKVIIDEQLKNIPLPTNMRSISETDKPVVRGTRMPINVDHTKVVRFYVHWKDASGREDLDLSATFLGMGQKACVAWNQNYNLVMKDLRTGKVMNDMHVAVHSGDVRHRKGDCAEYIDIDIKNALRCGFRYVLVDVRNYNDRPMKSVNPAFGYMEREHPEANTAWVPNTVAASWRLQSEAIACLAVMIDLETMEYIPLDIDSHSITATGDADAILTAMQMYMEPPKLSVRDLVMWHVDARGGEVMTEIAEGEEVQHFRFEDFAGSYIETLKLMTDTPPPSEE